MKRDQDYLRELLFEFEAQPDWLIVAFNAMNASPEQRQRLYHVQLLGDAGLVTEVGRSTCRLTNSGHDYIEAIRDEGVWSKTKAAVAETGGSATLEIVKSLAMGFLKKKIEKHTGITM